MNNDDRSPLEKIYDKQIRLTCSSLKTRFDECLVNNFNDEFQCQNTINDFYNCVQDFDKKFRRRYKLKQH